MKHAADAVGIRHQAARIIDSVLADTAPEHETAREMLRQQLAAHPGHPERALVEHLAALKAAGGAAGETGGAPSGTGRDPAAGE